MQAEDRKNDTIASWQERAIKELKGRALETLNWSNASGLDLSPYYNEENARLNFPVLHSRNTGEWDLFEPLVVQDVKQANKEALAALQGGATAITFRLPEHFDKAQLPQLLEQVELPYIQSGFQVHFNQYESFCLALAELIRKRGWNPKDTEGFIQVSFDGLSTADHAIALGDVVDATAAISAALIGYRLLVMDAARYREQGALDHEEMGLALAWYHEWLEKIEESGMTYNMLPKLWQLNLSSGGDYFLQMAKFRSANYLMSRVAEKFGDYRPMYIFAESSRFNQSSLDRYTNLLRLSVSGMAAANGGANGIVLFPFSQQSSDSPGFVNRVTRNIQLVLFHEAGLGDTLDPAQGSYYVEELTHSFAEKAWDFFLEIEAAGGFATYIGTGSLDTHLRKSREKQLDAIASGKKFMLGVNNYPKPESDIEPRKESFRWELPFLELREEIQKREEPVSLDFLLFGDANMSNARQSFSANFLGCAGIYGEARKWKPEDPTGNADIAVLCADDASYTQLRKLNKKEGQLIVIAGDPGEHKEVLRKAGVDIFIHRKSNMKETLDTVLEELK